MAKKVIGIDLGSTLSEVSVMEGGKPTIIINSEGERTTPSIVSIKNGERLVGSAAKRQAVTNPKTTINLIKRFMGGTYNEVKDNISHVQYDVKDVDGKPRIELEGKDYSPEEISAMILGKLKKTAEDYLGTTVEDAVITVPAYFSESAREATKNAAIIAGLNPLRLIAEPTAAILESKIDKEKGGKFMVVDYGGSTLDFSIADISDNVIEILASSGDVYTGGSDLDKILADWIVDEAKKDSSVDVSKDPLAMTRVNETAEKVKIELSNTTSTDINLPYLTVNDGVPVHFTKTINRATFESLIETELDKVVSFGNDALQKANIKANELNGILLVGGSTRIPLLQEKLEKTFNVTLLKNEDADCIVSLGAAAQGGILSGENTDILLLDVTPLRLGIKTMGDVMTTIVEANTTIPVNKEEVFSTAVDNQTTVEIEVLQGNRPMAADNKSLGKFYLDGIAPAPRGVPQIAVKFSISADGLLDVTATDKATGKEEHIKIEAKSSVTPEEIEKMKEEARINEEADKKRREEIDLLNSYDSLVFGIEKSLKENENHISDEQKSQISTLLEEIKGLVKEKKVDKAKTKVEELQKIWEPIITEIYKKEGEKTETKP